MAQPTFFIDTSYIVALFNPRDKFHIQARSVSSALAAKAKAVRSITTEAVLTEIGNAFAKLPHRNQGILILKAMRDDLALEIVSVDRRLFDQAVALYSSRDDKEWGLTDCISFVVMRERRMTDVLTTDHHFDQAGFRVAL